jgi:hypothetical protein
MKNSRHESSINQESLFILARFMTQKLHTRLEMLDQQLDYLRRYSEADAAPHFNLRASARVRGSVVRHLTVQELYDSLYRLGEDGPKWHYLLYKGSPPIREFDFGSPWYHLRVQYDESSLEQPEKHHQYYLNLKKLMQDGAHGQNLRGSLDGNVYGGKLNRQHAESIESCIGEVWDEEAYREDLEDDAESVEEGWAEGSHFEYSESIHTGSQLAQKEAWEAEDRLRYAATHLDGTSWDEPFPKSAFWERHLTKDKNGVFTPSLHISSLKERDPWAWDNRADQTFFIGRMPGDHKRANIKEIGADIDILGISELPIKAADEIWQIPGVDVALIMRKETDGYKLVSFAYLYMNPSSLKPLKQRALQEMESQGLNPSGVSWSSIPLLGRRESLK